MSYRIQQLGLGGVLDHTIAVVKDHFGLLMRIVLMMMVPINLVAGLVMLRIFPVSTSIFPSREQQAATEAAFAQYWPIFLVIGLLSGLVVLPVTYAALIQAVAHVYLGKPITAVVAIKDGFRLWGPLLGTAILYYLAYFGGFLLLLIGAIIFGLWFYLCLYVVVIEGTSGPAALGRSRKLVRGHMGSLFVLTFVLWLITAPFQFMPNSIPSGVVRVVAATFLQAFTAILCTTAGVVFYFSCRCANENFDLHFYAQNIVEPALVEGPSNPIVG